MTMLEERTARLEADRENEQEWRREILARFDHMESRFGNMESRLDHMESRFEARLDRLEGNQRWMVGLTILLHGVTIGAIFAAAALF